VNYGKGEKYVRGYLEDLARKRQFDPLIAENWYIVPRQEFLEHWVCKHTPKGKKKR
jgi:hypothetical protein